MLMRTLKSYVDRRLRLPIRRSDLVIDIGGGDRPHWRADVIVDRFPEAEFASQRFLGGGMRSDRPIFAVDAGELPFRTGAFDYAVCSHTLEHVPDPAAAIAEMTRVAKRGYIEVPAAGMAKIHDFATHLWWCSLEDDVLVFRAKEARAFDPDIERFVGNPLVRPDIQRIATRNFDHCIVAVRWEGSIKVRVEGVPNLALSELEATDTESFRFMTVLSRRLTTALALTTWSARRRRVPLTYGKILDVGSFGGLTESISPGVHRPPSED